MRPLVQLIDDDQDTLALYALALSGMGFDLIAAREPAEAFTQAWTHHPDAIVTELRLAHTLSWELIVHLKSEPRTRDIPVVVLTADGMTATEARARDAGCAAFLVKPCLPDQLALTLRQVLSLAFAHVPVRSHQ